MRVLIDIDKEHMEELSKGDIPLTVVGTDESLLLNHPFDKNEIFNLLPYTLSKEDYSRLIHDSYSTLDFVDKVFDKLNKVPNYYNGIIPHCQSIITDTFEQQFHKNNAQEDSRPAENNVNESSEALYNEIMKKTGGPPYYSTTDLGPLMDIFLDKGESVKFKDWEINQGAGNKFWVLSHKGIPILSCNGSGKQGANGVEAAYLVRESHVDDKNFLHICGILNQRIPSWTVSPLDVLEIQSNQISISLDGLREACRRFDLEGEFGECGPWRVSKFNKNSIEFRYDDLLLSLSSHERLFCIANISDKNFIDFCQAVSDVLPQLKMSKSEKEFIEINQRALGGR